MTQHSITVGPADDAARFLATDQAVWFEEVPAAPVEVQLLGIPADQRFAAETGTKAGTEAGDGTTYAGIYGVFPLTLHLPGPAAGSRAVPAAGLTWVGVHPDHRRQGVLSAMLRHHFDQVHATEGTHVSVLHASEPAIYGRHGYGLASLELEVGLGRGATLTAPHLEAAAAGTTTAMGAVADDGMPARLRACHLAAAAPGEVVGELGYYQRICRELPEDLRDKEPWRVLLARRDGVDVGFALFRRTQKWEKARPASEVSVWRVVGDPATRLVLLRRLVDLDLVGSATVKGVGLDDPLVLWAGGPRATSAIETYDSLWVRLVDLAEALADRAWSAPCDLVVEVGDRVLPWNDGRWRVRAAQGSAEVTRTDAAPDLALDVALLGAAFLGGGNLVAAHRAGLVEEHRPGAVAELWEAMRTPVAPAAAIEF